MSFLLKYLSFTLLAGALGRDVYIQSPRITNWGTWGEWDYCNTGQVTIGFRLKVAEHQRNNENTGLNGIILLCGQPNSRRIQSAASSTVGKWGSWHYESFCDGALTGFQLRSMVERGTWGDDIAAVAFRGICWSGQVLESVKDNSKVWLHWSTWTQWQHCPTGMAICAIQTQVEEPQGGLAPDNTALNNVDMKCCPIPSHSGSSN